MKKMNKKGVSHVLGVAVLIIIIVVGTLAGYWFYLDIQSKTEEVADPYYGTMSLTIAQLNTFDRSTVSPTTPKYEVFSPGGVSLDAAEENDFTNPKGGATLPSEDDISVNPEDNGYFWLRAYGGTAHFVDIEATRDANSRIRNHEFIDVNSDNKLDVIFEVYVGDMGTPGQAQKVPFDLSVLLVTDDGTNVAMSSPANKTMSNGTQTGAVEWELTTFAEKKGFALARIYVKQTRTEEDYIHVTSVSVSYAPSAVNEVDPAPGYESGAKKWTVDLDITDYRQCVYGIMIMRDTGEASKVSVTVAFESYFSTAGAQEVGVTLYGEIIKPTSAFYTTLSDEVYVKNT